MSTSISPRTIIISRTDSIGDVMLTLPICGILKKYFPKCRIVFLAASYTEAVVETCIHVDEYMDWTSMKEKSPTVQIDILKKQNADAIIHVFPRKEILWLAKRAEITMRIATGRRLRTILKCNKLVFFTRRNSLLHEAQLNVKLLKPFGIEREFTLEELQQYTGFTKFNEHATSVVTSYLNSLKGSKRRIILHPLSKGSAAEWGLNNFQELATILSKSGYEIFITGTAQEGKKIAALQPFAANNLHDITGKFSLAELIVFIAKCDALVAASTGPLHIAAAVGISAIGLYPPQRPMHAGRWAPLGENAHVFTSKNHPSKGEQLSIAPSAVAKYIAKDSV